ncbi:MAG TPA: TIGR01777 family oxidoreductase [Verrucomicrobiae bacterium]|jgi:hypothetical protein
MIGAKRIVIAGGSGFIGRALAAAFSARGFAVTVLTRSPRERGDGVREVAWNGEHLGEWIQSLDGAQAVINLTGKNINCPHTPENMDALIASRVNSVRIIATAFEHVKIPPRVWVQASATGFYGDTGDQICNEAASAGDNHLAEICRHWEGAFHVAKVPATRKVVLRIGFVLGRDGGALPVLGRLTRYFLGGAAGGGKQFVSWIHLTDLVRMFVTAAECERFGGTFNAVAPDALTNAEFMRALRRALHRPWSPPVPEFMIRIGCELTGSEPALALTSSRCVPERFLGGEFKFQFPKLAAALKDLCGKADFKK